MKNKNSGVYKEIKLHAMWKEFSLQKGARRALLATCALNIFYAISTIYVPLYLISQIGFSWEKIGILLSIALTPFILFGMPLGFLTNKKGEKVFLLSGFLIITLSMLLVPLIEKSNFFYFTLLFFISRIGAVCVEVASDSYFFKIAKGKDELISLYRLGVPFAVIVGPLLGMLLIPFGLQYTFFIISGITFIAFLAMLGLPPHTPETTYQDR
jgi:MFS family permease